MEVVLLPPQRAEKPRLNWRSSSLSSSSTRQRQGGCTCSRRVGMVQCRLHGCVVPGSGDRFRRSGSVGGNGGREILRRALMPPSRRVVGRRWLNFRPTPSRLCNVSTA
ncbi:hypothetical protein MLD38_022007 [Melastoma candidum]|uniref:Uncharacterized protein n=1 Tax=Melastoma candidum TaxID=119954 RepID=A0ACB9QJ20_9MYRT|nr:hypothetical protein MLD38_022007 [Melastoma candidum]